MLRKVNINRSQPRRVMPVLCSSLLMVCALGLTFHAPAAETQMSEREHLARVLHELDALKPILINAQRAPKDPGRSRFKYRSLQRDLKLMRDGIESYIHHNLDQPRDTIIPLSGGYSE